MDLSGPKKNAPSTVGGKGTKKGKKQAPPDVAIAPKARSHSRGSVAGSTAGKSQTAKSVTPTQQRDEEKALVVDADISSGASSSTGRGFFPYATVCAECGDSFMSVHVKNNKRLDKNENSLIQGSAS